MILSIDPGLRACGCALWEGDNLVDAEWVKNPEKLDRGPFAWFYMAQAVVAWKRRCNALLVVEVPRIYPHSGQQKGDLNDLLELAGVVGALSNAIAVTHFYYPADWKGQVPKKVMNNRVLAELSSEELACMKSKDHNTIDAVGIGLHFFCRLTRKTT